MFRQFAIAATLAFTAAPTLAQDQQPAAPSCEQQDLAQTKAEVLHFQNVIEESKLPIMAHIEGNSVYYTNIPVRPKLVDEELIKNVNAAMAHLDDDYAAQEFIAKQALCVFPNTAVAHNNLMFILQAVDLDITNAVISDPDRFDEKTVEQYQARFHQYYPDAEPQPMPTT